MRLKFHFMKLVSRIHPAEKRDLSAKYSHLEVDSGDSTYILQELIKAKYFPKDLWSTE